MELITWNNLSEAEKYAALSRPAISICDTMTEEIRNIIKQVKTDDDEALLDFAEKFDKVKLSNLKVSAAEFKCARSSISDDAKKAIEFAKRQLEKNHSTQLPHYQLVETCEGVICERQARPIDCVGLYIPGGSAPLVSTALMLGVPAKLANSRLRIMCSPPNKKGEIDPHILFAAEICDIQNVYKVGGAQAVAAMAYGTKTIPKVNKIFGPGNAWVTQAKLLVAQDPAGASIDMPAGPSEVMIIADETANPDFIAADLLSQAEHGTDSQVMLVSTSIKLANEVKRAIEQQLISLPRYDIAKQSLAQSRIIIVDTIEQAISISNEYAPEHLILQVNNFGKYISQIQNAGAVFLGEWSPETVGDYVTGSNHVLPTYGYAKSYTGLSVTDFMKFISFQTITKSGLKKIGPYAEKLAEIEGLDAHKRAVAKRLSTEKIYND